MYFRLPESFANAVKPLGLLSCIITALFFAYFSQTSKFDTGNWLEKEHPRQKELDQFKHTFGTGTDSQALLIQLEGASLLDKEIRTELNRLAKNLSKIPGISSVETPLDSRVFSNSLNNIEFVSFQQMFNSEDYTSEIFKSDFENSIYYRKTVSENFKVFLILFDINDSNRENIFSRIKQELLLYSSFKKNYFYSDDFFEHEINNDSLHSIVLVSVLTIAFISLLVLVVYKNLVYVALISYIVTLSLLYTCSAFAFIGYNITVVSTILLSLILIISFSDSLYIINVWRSQDINSHTGLRLASTFRQTWKPCLITSLTTSVGFGSFYFSALLPFKHLGAVSVISILGSYVIIMIGTLFLLALFDQKPIPTGPSSRKDRSSESRSLGIGSPGTMRLALLVILAHLGAALPVIFGKVNVESNLASDFLDSNSSPYSGLELANKELYTNNTIELIYRRNQEDYFKSIENFQSLARIQTELGKWEHVAEIDSYIDIISMLHKKVASENDTQNPLPLSQDQLSQELLFIEFMSSSEVEDLLQPYIDFDYSSTRLHIKLNKRLERNDLKNYLARITAISQEHSNIKPLLTGGLVYDFHLSSELIKTQIDSVLIIALGILILFVSLFGLRLGTIGAVANILPFIALLGTISRLNINFDFAAILAFSINFGLMVDMSIHVLDRLAKNSATEGSSTFSKQDIESAINFITRPVINIFLTMLVCYSLFATSDIFLLQKFGALSIPVLLASVVINLLVLPSLIYMLLGRQGNVRFYTSTLFGSIKR